MNSTTESAEDMNVEDLQTEIQFLREENTRLRKSYLRAQESRYRRTAAGFAILGGIAVIAAIVFVNLRTILVAFGGVGLFTALLIWFITPERFVAETVGNSVYETVAINETEVASQLGLASVHVYLANGGSEGTIKLFQPQHRDYDVPDGEALSDPLVVTGEPAERGVSFQPTGRSLFRELKAASQGSLPSDPATVTESLREAIVEQFELTSSIEMDLDPNQGRLTIEAPTTAFGDITQFDHPIVSLVAVALAVQIEKPIQLDRENDITENSVTLRWESPD
jgi:hypothetical protein